MNAGPSTLTAPHRDNLAAWSVVMAPGLLLTRAVVTVALIASARLHPSDVNPRLLCAVASGYLAVQVAGALWMVRRPGSVAAVLCRALLATDAVIVGLLLGGGLAWRGPGVGVAVAATGLAVEADGWTGALLSGAVIAVVTGAVVWSGVFSSLPAVPAFSPALSTERSFLRAPVDGAAPPRFSPVLSVERSFNGVTAGRFPASSPPIFPLLLAAMLALVVGNGVNLARSRRMQTAVADAMAVAQRLASLSCGAPEQ